MKLKHGDLIFSAVPTKPGFDNHFTPGKSWYSRHYLVRYCLKDILKYGYCSDLVLNYFPLRHAHVV